MKMYKHIAWLALAVVCCASIGSQIKARQVTETEVTEVTEVSKTEAPKSMQKKHMKKRREKRSYKRHGKANRPMSAERGEQKAVVWAKHDEKTNETYLLLKV